MHVSELVALYTAFLMQKSLGCISCTCAGSDMLQAWQSLGVEPEAGPQLVALLLVQAAAQAVTGQLRVTQAYSVVTGA